jgi:hypothetical protein
MIRNSFIGDGTEIELLYTCYLGADSSLEIRRYRDGRAAILLFSRFNNGG